MSITNPEVREILAGLTTAQHHAGGRVDWTGFPSARDRLSRSATNAMVDYARGLDTAARYSDPEWPLGWFSTDPIWLHEASVVETFPGGRTHHPGLMALDVGIRMYPDLTCFGPDPVDRLRMGWCRLVHEVHLTHGRMCRTLQPGWPPITGVSDLDAAMGLLADLTHDLSERGRQEWVARWLAALIGPVQWAPSRRDATQLALDRVMLRRWAQGAPPDCAHLTRERLDLAGLLAVPVPVVVHGEVVTR
jgi:hypothetical protein